MVPVIVHRIGQWLDQFTEALHCWESLLCDLRSAYFRQDSAQVSRLHESVESAKRMMVANKSERESILAQAHEQGLRASSLRELSRLLDGQWPALWTHRILGLENQVSRIQQLGVSLWIHTSESRELVSELLQLLGARSPQLPRQLHPLHPLKVDADSIADDQEPVIIPFERKAA